MMMLNFDFVLRLLVAGILGAIIGLDREYRAKEAGYRTHFLVSLGSALIMIVSQYGFQEIIKESSVTLDPSRVAAQVVSGIGFIGAGTIIFQKQIVRRCEMLFIFCARQKKPTRRLLFPNCGLKLRDISVFICRCWGC